MRGPRTYGVFNPYLRKGDTAFVVAQNNRHVKIIECRVNGICWYWRKWPWTRDYPCYYWVMPKTPLRGRDKKLFSFYFGHDMGLGDCLFKTRWEAKEALVERKMSVLRLDTSQDYVIISDDE